MTGQDRAAIIDEIAGLLSGTSRELLPEPNFTVGEMAQRLGVDPDTALKRLKRLVKDGQLEMDTVFDEGHWRLVFWRKDAGGQG